MKVCVIQPEYSVDYARSEELFEKQLHMDDNFSIPLISGAVIWLSTILFLQHST